MDSSAIQKLSELHLGAEFTLARMRVVQFNLGKYLLFGGARGVMVIVVGNGHSDSSSNPGLDS